MTYERPGPGSRWAPPLYGPITVAEIDGPAPVYGAGLQLHGGRARRFGSRSLSRGFDGLLSTDRRDTVYLDRHAGAARDGASSQLGHRSDQHRRGLPGVLDICHADGPFVGRYLSRVHRG